MVIEYLSCQLPLAKKRSQSPRVERPMSGALPLVFGFISWRNYSCHSRAGSWTRHRRGESRDVYRQSNIDSCLLRRLLSFRRNDNLLNTGPFWGYGRHLEKAIGGRQLCSVYFCNEAISFFYFPERIRPTFLHTKCYTTKARQFDREP